MLAILVATLLSAAPGQAPSLVAEPCEFGETYQLSAVHCTVAYTNNADTPMHIAAAAAAAATDSVTPAAATIAAHATAYFDVTANVENDRGRTEHFFYATTDAGVKVYTRASGFVLSLLDGPMPQIDFGVIQAGAGATEQVSKSLTLDTREVSGFRLKSIVKAPAYLDCRIGDDGRTLIVSFKPNAPWGTLGEYVVISTNTPKQPTVYVRIKADVHGDVVPSENPVQLGMMRLGDKNESLIVLKNPAGKDFKIGKIEVERLHATTQVEPCVPAARGCNLLRLAILDTQPLGMVSGRLRIGLPDYHRDISLAVGGLLLKRDTVVKDMDEKADKANPQSGQTTPGTSLDLSKALRNATKRADPAEPPGHGPLLKWSVANEELVYGYLIYRGDAEGGPFVRVNDAIIPALNEDDSSEYKWRDTSAVSGHTYWYYIGVLKQSGVRQDLTGPQKVVAK